MAATISLAMIVKNEAALLPECIDAIAPVADEICVVDTGSDDDSAAIARRNGCRVESFPWCDDFAAARNASLAMSTGDWIFVLDADERIAPQDLPAIRALAAGPRDAAYRFITRNYTDSPHRAGFVPSAPEDPFAGGFAGWFPSGKVRLFPNGLGAAFEGAVHELVNPSIVRLGLEIRTAEVPIHHYPLLKSDRRLLEKHRLYVTLGRRKIEDNPEDPQGYLELGNQYLELGNYQDAAALFRDGLHVQPEHPLLLKDLGAALQLLGRGGPARQALELALRIKPDMTDAWRNLGVVHGSLGDWAAAAAAFDCAVRLDPADAESQRYLALALRATGRTEKAYAAAAAAVRDNPASPEAAELYAELAAHLGRQREARALLEQLEAAGHADPALRRVLPQ